MLYNGAKRKAVTVLAPEPQQPQGETGGPSVEQSSRKTSSYTNVTNVRHKCYPRENVSKEKVCKSVFP